ncbi:hypothetical protein RHGRI_008374 [Rhododendron griersonianum]|uniref:Uncharacterized protein n=1 Tax=Rhododendron griersonianum TaxID=479676 RepID=A0AAV6L398_9ERIC|nr:hypothetical protein RHGRI_008374 [Rhododendron griersonianum]
MTDSRMLKRWKVIIIVAIHKLFDPLDVSWQLHIDDFRFSDIGQTENDNSSGFSGQFINKRTCIGFPPSHEVHPIDAEDEDGDQSVRALRYIRQWNCCLIKEEEEERNWIFSVDQMQDEGTDGDEPDWHFFQNATNTIGHSNEDHNLAHTVLEV